MTATLITYTLDWLHIAFMMMARYCAKFLPRIRLTHLSSNQIDTIDFLLLILYHVTAVVGESYRVDICKTGCKIIQDKIKLLSYFVSGDVVWHPPDYIGTYSLTRHLVQKIESTFLDKTKSLLGIERMALVHEI